jgi:hypothetical protein
MNIKSLIPKTKKGILVVLSVIIVVVVLSLSLGIYFGLQDKSKSVPKTTKYVQNNYRNTSGSGASGSGASGSGSSTSGSGSSTSGSGSSTSGSGSSTSGSGSSTSGSGSSTGGRFSGSISEPGLSSSTFNLNTGKTDLILSDSKLHGDASSVNFS